MIDKNEYFKTIRRNIIFEKVTQPMRIRSYFENKKYLVYTDNFRQRILEQSNLVVPGMPDMQFSKDRMLKNCKDENIQVNEITQKALYCLLTIRHLNFHVPITD